jgi:hypothetical protein
MQQVPGRYLAFKQSIFGVSLLSAVTFTSSVSAEPSAEEACQYFLTEVPITGQAVKTTHVAPSAPEFKSLLIGLGRYQTLVESNYRVEFGENTDQSFNKLGELSVEVVCTVDILDRSVIRITIGAGSDVGKEALGATDYYRKIGAPKPIEAQIALGPHGGRY